ncbi:hypothetical protein AUC45_03610 [Erythrobacter sp. YT30]|nr:hypothetical protein AUC45_03610 [Erythrobacter sp. YT30]
MFVAVFVLINYGEPQRVKIWPSADPVGFDWPVGVIALAFWLLGVIPFWIYHRGVKWSLNRRIRSLENSMKSNALSRRPDPELNSTPPVDEPADKPAEKLGETGGLSPEEGSTR